MTWKLLFAGIDTQPFHQIREAFSEEDAFTITASSVALALFLARKNKPDIILAAEKFVDGDAVSFFYETRNESDTALIPFVFLLSDKQSKNDLLEMIGRKYVENRIYFFCENNEKAEDKKLCDWKNKILNIISPI